MTTDKTKIAIITQSLANGGAERSSALLSVLLSNLGFDIHVITVLDKIEYEFKGELLNLGKLKTENDTFLGRFNRLLVFKKYLKKHNFDWIIDNRTRMSWWSELILSKFIYNPKKTIYVVHSFKIVNYFPIIPFIAKRIYKKSPYIIAVSNEIKLEIENKFGYQNVIMIYNSFERTELLKSAEQDVLPDKYILAYGRIEDEIKNYSLLMEGYSQSILPKMNINLFIIGDGKDVEKLKQKAISLNLSDKIIFKPKMTNPFSYVKSALFSVLTSKYEGFPRVIIESLALDTPVISVDCHSGPKEIIINEQNGLLIANNNVDVLAKAMNRFVEDKNLYDICKNNASKSITHLSEENIAKEWLKILNK